MAIIRTIPRRGRRPVHTGRIMVDTVRGVLRVRKWPRKRPGKRTPIERFWTDWFVQANKLAKYADPMSLARAIQMTKGSGMYPRDVLLKAMRGRLYAWTTPDGWKWYSMAAIGDISESLDVLAQTPGDILVRALDRWRKPPDGVLGDVLTNAGPGAPPAWATPVPPVTPFVGALVHKTVNQGLVNQVMTVLTWDQELYDLAALHDNVTNNSRLTIPLGWSYAQLTLSVKWALNNNNSRFLRFHKNGAEFQGGAVSRKQATSFSEHEIVSHVIPVVEGDYFEAAAWQDTGGNLSIIADIRCSFSIAKLG